jgi:SAM-dependent methyltransferase
VSIRFARSFLGWLMPSRRMREDWDARARENARHYIDCGHGQSDESFRDAGRYDVTSYVLRDLRLDPAATVVEIGCGMGRLLRPMSERSALALGFDISGEMITRATDALRDRPNIRVSVTEGDLPGVADASVDLVYSFIVFQHIPVKRAISRYIREAARALKSGGIFRFQVDGRERHGRHRLPGGGIGGADTWLGVWYHTEEIQAEVQAAGFELLDTYGEDTHYLWLTARRAPEPGRASTTLVQHQPTRWNAAAVHELLRRMELDAETEAPRVLAGQTSVRRLADTFIASAARLDPAAFVSRTYEALLDRPADPSGLGFHADQIREGIDRANVVDCLLTSSEFAERHREPAP